MKLDTSWFRVRAKELGKKRTTLAALLGRTYGTVTHIFAGKRAIKLSEVDILADFFEMNLADFLRQCGVDIDAPAAEINQDAMAVTIEGALKTFDAAGEDVSYDLMARIIAFSYKSVAQDKGDRHERAKNEAAKLLAFSRRNQQ